MKTTLLIIILLLSLTAMSCVPDLSNNPYMANVYKQANEGNVESQKKLARAYELGHGVPKDLTKSFFWYKKAADANDAEAQYLIYNYYRTGRGEKKDNNLAFAYLLLSAKHGYARAQYEVALKYGTGTDVEKNDDESFMWAYRASKQGYRNAVEYIEEVSPLMDPEKVNELIKKTNERQMQ